MHNTVNNSCRLSVQPTSRPSADLHYLELTKKPYNSAYINLGKRLYSYYTNLIKFVKNSVKFDEETFVY